MSHIPYGYEIIDGRASIIEKEAEIIRCIFKNYISGMSLSESAVKAGYHVTHSMVKTILKRKIYCGDEFYPPIIEREIYEQANAELAYRAGHLNHRLAFKNKAYKIHTAFEIDIPDKELESPEKQAEYLYSLIGVK